MIGQNNQKKYFMNSIRKKVIIPILIVLIPLFTAGFLFLSTQNEKQAIAQVKSKLLHQVKLVKENISRISKKALSISSLMASIEGVEKAYLMKNENAGRTYLRNITKRYYRNFTKNLKVKNVKIHYHKPPAMSFLRLWRKPGVRDGGDDISAFRETVLDISRSHKPITSFEVGRGGPVIRGISPIIRDNVYYGSVENLFPFAETYKFVDNRSKLLLFLKSDIATIINEKSMVANFKKVGNYTYISSSDNSYSRLVDEKIFNSIKKTHTVTREQHFIVYEPLTDYRNKQVGVMVFISDMSQQFAEIQKMKYAQILLFCLVLVFLMGFIFFVLNRSIVKPVRSLQSVTEQIAQGDLTVSAPVTGNDEIGRLCYSFNSFIESIHDMVYNIITGSNSLADSIKQISGGNYNLSQRTSEQASSLEEISSTVEETSGITVQNAENTQNAKSLALTATGLAETGGQISTDAVSSITSVNELSKKIGDITSLINEISFQTNLLALNASVEAARAGEAGRGFAVVAGEIRNLAQRSGNAASEIEHLIKDTVQQIEQGTDLVKKSGESLDSIIKSIKEVDRIVTEVSITSEEQKQGISQLNIAITELDTMTQQNAALVEETASASEDMENLARELIQATRRFTVRDAALAREREHDANLSPSGHPDRDKRKQLADIPNKSN
jgi:methyl-accepting chemotaxis protein